MTLLFRELSKFAISNQKVSIFNDCSKFVRRYNSTCKFKCHFNCSTFEAQKPHGARAVAAIKRYEEIVNTITESLNTSKNANSFIQDVNVRVGVFSEAFIQRTEVI